MTTELQEHYTKGSLAAEVFDELQEEVSEQSQFVMCSSLFTAAV